eukprot:4224209-Ditylum_brightwellii.AAC.1
MHGFMFSGGKLGLGVGTDVGKFLGRTFTYADEGNYLTLTSSLWQSKSLVCGGCLGVGKVIHLEYQQCRSYM